MGTPKWQGAGAFVKAASATEEPASDYLYPDLESIGIASEPITYERRPGIHPDIDRIYAAGFSLPWSMGGIQPTAAILGRLLHLFLGAEANVGGVHTITPADDTDYLNVLEDVVQDLGTSTPTRRLIGAKVGSLTLDLPIKEVAKLDVGGMGCDHGTLAASLSPSVPTGADNAPLSWASLQDASGYFKIGLDGAVAAQDDEITGFKIEATRNIIPSGVQLGSDQPTKLSHGFREIFFEITKEFSGANAKAQFTAWKAQQSIEVLFKGMIGANYVQLESMHGYPVAPMIGDVGASEEIITGVLRCKAYKNGALDIFKAIVADSVDEDY